MLRRVKLEKKVCKRQQKREIKQSTTSTELQSA